MASKKRDTWKAIGKALATKARVIAGYEHYGRILYIEDEVTLINRAKALLKAERIGKGKQREG